MVKSRTLRAKGSLSPDELCQLFVESLEDPYAPRHCVRYYRGALASLLHSDLGPANFELLAEEKPDVFDTCARFLTAPRTEEEMERLNTSISMCACDLSDAKVKEIHRLASQSYKERRKDSEWSINDLVDTFMAAIHNPLQSTKASNNLHKVSRNAQKAAREGKKLKWPRSHQDILPYGTDVSIRMLGQWIELSPMPTTMGVMGSILELYKRSAIRPFIMSPTLPGKFLGVSEIPWFMMLGMIAPGQKIDYPYTIGELKRCALVAQQLVYYAEPEEMVLLHKRTKEQHGDLLSFCSALLDFMKVMLNDTPLPLEAKTDLAYIVEWFHALGVQLHHCLDLPYDTARYHPNIVAGSKLRVLIEANAPQMAFETFCRLAGEQRCFAPGCANTCAREGRKFENCAACRRTPYCSKACQVSAWKHPRAPHKEVCKKLRQLADETGVGSRLELKDALHFVETCSKKKIDKDLIGDVVVHMRSLRKEMILRKTFPDSQSSEPLLTIP